MKITGGIIHQSRPEIDKKPSFLNSHLAACHNYLLNGYCLIVFVQTVFYTSKMNDWKLETIF